MKYILKGEPKEVEKVLRENRIRIQRGVIEFTPVEEDLDPEEPVTDSETVDNKHITLEDTKEASLDEDEKASDSEDSKDMPLEDTKEAEPIRNSSRRAKKSE